MNFNSFRTPEKQNHIIGIKLHEIRQLRRNLFNIYKKIDNIEFFTNTLSTQSQNNKNILKPQCNTNNIH